MTGAMTDTAAAAALRIGIIGLGSRGLSVLERIATLAPKAGDRTFAVTVFEPNEPGLGLHDRQQPDYLLLNTIAAQISIFPTVDEPYLETDFPDFHDWCRKRGLRIGADLVPCETAGRPVLPTDFLPRRLLGDYLAEAFDDLIGRLPANVTVDVIRQPAVALTTTEGDGYRITPAAGAAVSVDRLFVTVGHTGKHQTSARSVDARTIDAVYPLPASVAAIPAGANIGINGLGLAAMDVVAALTKGRGGRFSGYDTAAALSYEPSGEEPVIHLFSRKGLPYRVRPETYVRRQSHQALFLVPKTIAALRAARPDGRLDFDDDILPLIEDEMRLAYYETWLRNDGGGHDASPAALRARLSAAAGAEARAAIFAEAAERCEPFTPADHLVTALPGTLPADDYPAWARRFIADDLNEGRRGLEVSPLKTALEIWRDLRETLRTIINQRGLTDASHQRFFTVYAPLVNRTVAGPQKERHAELLALMNAGLVRIVPAPRDAQDRPATGPVSVTVAGQAVTLDWLVQARVEHSGLLATDSGILADLSAARIIRPVMPVPGLDSIDIDAGCRAIDGDGRSVANLWVLGPAVEGATYYNHYVPSGGSRSRARLEAHAAVVDCLSVAPNLGATVAPDGDVPGQSQRSHLPHADQRLPMTANGG